MLTTTFQSCAFKFFIKVLQEELGIYIQRLMLIFLRSVFQQLDSLFLNKFSRFSSYLFDNKM